MQKMKFYDIAKGKFALDVQEAFEEAQIKATKDKVQTKVCIEIAIAPPKEDDQFGQVAYSTNVKSKKQVSMAFTAEFHQGQIVDDGKDVASLLQYDMNIPEEDVSNG